MTMIENRVSRLKPTSFSGFPSVEITPRQDYYILPADNRRLTKYVDRLENSELALSHRRSHVIETGVMDPDKIAATLPEGVEIEHFESAIEHAMKLEAAVDLYIVAFNASANHFSQSWLGRFFNRVWLPGEREHVPPFKNMLLSLGHSEESVDKSLRDVKNETFTKYDNFTPVHSNASGMFAEYFSVKGYTYIMEMLRPAYPEAAQMVGGIRRVEANHLRWFRDMLATQLESNPRLIYQLAESIAGYTNIGKELFPDLHEKSQEWLPIIESNPKRIQKNLTQLSALVSPSNAAGGRLLLEVAGLTGIETGRFSPEQLRFFADHLGEVGYSLVGEAVLLKLGLKEVFDDQGWIGNVKKRLRVWIADQISF